MSPMEFFRHCPGCGRRFHIKLVDKKMVELERKSVTRRESTVLYGGSPSISASPAFFLVQEGKPVIIDVEEFQYAYRCQHCGHEWSEKRVEEHKER